MLVFDYCIAYFAKSQKPNTWECTGVLTIVVAVACCAIFSPSCTNGAETSRPLADCEVTPSAGKGSNKQTTTANFSVNHMIDRSQALDYSLVGHCHNRTSYQLAPRLHGDVGVLKERVGGEHGVVRLDDSGGDLRRRINGEPELGFAAVDDGEALEEEGSGRRQQCSRP